MEVDAGREEAIIPEREAAGKPPAAIADENASAPCWAPPVMKLAGERRLRRWLPEAAAAKSSQRDMEASSSRRSIGTEALE
jgi:hypothetical protein